MSALSPEQIKLRVAFGSLRQKLGQEREKPYKALSQEKLAKLLGCSWSTVARIESKGRGEILLSEKVTRIHDLLDSFNPPIPQHERLAFLETPSEKLRGCRPIAFMDNQETFEAAKRALELN